MKHAFDKKNEVEYPSGTRSIQRAINIIKAVAQQQEKGITLSKISRATDLPMSTVKRILLILSCEGFVTINEASKRYYLGYEFHTMIRQSTPLMVKEKYHHALEAIANETEDAAYLVIRDNLSGLCIDAAKGTHAVSIPYEMGSRTPLGAIASGIAILSTMQEKDVEAILQVNQSFFSEIHLNLDTVRERIEECRNSGFVRCDSYKIAGLMNVGTPVLDDQGFLIGAIVVSSTTRRLPPKRCEKIYRLIHELVFRFSKQVK